MTDYATYLPTLTSYGARGGAVTPDDSADLDPIPKAIEVTVAGTLEVLPVNNADGEWVDCGDCAKGYQPPFRVRRVKESSAATVIWIGD